MGKSQTIEDMQKENAKFREFMKELETDAQTEEDRISGILQELVKRHYEGNGWDHARLFGQRTSDYQNYSDWSLTRVTSIINSIGDALQAGNFPSPEVPGSDEASPDALDTATKFLGGFTEDFGLTISRVTALVSGVLSQFAVKSEVKRNAETRDLPLSGGMHLFFGCSGKVEKRKDFFTSQFIGSFQIVFDTYISADEARALGLSQILKVTDQELEILNQMILDLRAAQAESLRKIMNGDMADYVSTKAAYDVAIAAVKEDRDEVFQEYSKYKGVTDTVDSLFPKLDLSEFGGAPIHGAPLQLDHVFNDWEAQVARRYIKESIGSTPEPAAAG